MVKPACVAELDIIDHSKFDTEAKIAASRETASFRARHLENAILIGATLTKVDFTAANLSGAKLDHADLRGAAFVCASVSKDNCENKRSECTLLEHASFAGAQLQHASLDGAQLRFASFQDTLLQDASLKCAQIQDAYFNGAQLKRAALSGADLQRADLSGADFEGADLDEAVLKNVSGSYSKLRGNPLFGPGCRELTCKMRSSKVRIFTKLGFKVRR